MASINKTELDVLERRAFHLSILASIFVLVLASGVALLMYPLVFVHPDEGSKWSLRGAFVGFCVLTLLFVVYLLDRHRTVSKLKQHLVEELNRNIEQRRQANADMLRSIPDMNHFQDQLAMEYRRASNMKHPLSFVAVKVKLSIGLAGEQDQAEALGEAAKAIWRNLRPSDSIYLLSKGLFGLILPETDSSAASNIGLQIEETLRALGAPNKFSFEVTTTNYPDHVKSAHEFEEIVSSLMPERSVWSEVGASR